MRHLTVALVLFAATLSAGSPPNGLPLFFVANRGQAPAHVRYMAQGSGVTAYFSPEEAVFRIAEAHVHMRFVGANSLVRIEGLEPMPAQANFLTGSPPDWHLGVPMFTGIAYRDLYPGIDMIYGGDGRKLKSEFIVAPGGDPSGIRLRYVGSGGVHVDDDGCLEIAAGDSTLREQAPQIYQQNARGRVPVSGRFAVAEDGTVSFEIGPYDRSHTLVIDPVVLSYGTLVGGSGSDAAMALAVDNNGAAYVAGFTASYDLPTANPEQNFNAGGNDVFVAKLNPSGNGLVYCTYLGGKGDDRAYGIAVDASGSAYVTGSTTSTNFPTRNALQSKLAGSKNAFALKLNSAGNSLVFSTYLGGNASDTAYGVALDGSGNMYVTGDTTSITFPATGMQRGNRGGQDAFVFKLSADGSHLLYGTYLGGTADDHGAAIAVDASGSAYVTGSTYSTNFPVAGASQGTLAGGQDAFLAKLSADGSSLLFGTFLGGSGGTLGYPESGQGIALDAQGGVYVTGVTSSTNFPTLNPLQSSLRGSSDAFVTKWSASGALVYSTYLGGTGVDAGNAIAVDSNGSAYIAGQTFSSDLAVTNTYQAVSGGDYDGFWAKLSSSGNSLVSLGYLGGSGSDTATALALDPSGNAYIAGWTLSPNFPLANAYQSTNGGNYGAFVTKMGFGAPPAPGGVTPNSGTGSTQTFTFSFTDAAGASDITTASALFNSSQTLVSGCSVLYTAATNKLALLTDSGAVPAGSITPGSGTQQNSQCTLNGTNSSVSRSGNVLTLNLSISFLSPFGASLNIYSQAVNPFGASAWQLDGTWSTAAGPPSAVSVTPGSGTGTSQTFSFVYSDPRGYAAISSASIVINGSLYVVNSCYVYYLRASNAVYLANDAGTAWLGPVSPGQSGSVQNSQCSVAGTGSSAVGTGNQLTLTLAVSFLPGFTGSKSTYMEVYDGSDSGWQSRGSWTVPSLLSAVSVTPASGTGASQTFSFLYSDPKGYSAISSASIIVNSSLYVVNACYLYYVPSSNVVYLANDAGTAWLGPVTLGQAGTVQNSQCTVSGTGSSATGTSSNLTINLSLTFQPAFSGSKNLYLEANDGTDSGWQARGTWTVPVSLAAVSATPSSGSGRTQTFSFAFTDPNGYAAISSASIIINGPLYAVGACYLYFSRSANAVYLANDAATAWLGPVTLGQSGSIQNSQCSVSGTGSSSTGSGSNLTITLALNFLAAFTGPKSIFMEVYDGSDSGWQQRGSWTVP